MDPVVFMRTGRNRRGLEEDWYDRYARFAWTITPTRKLGVRHVYHHGTHTEFCITSDREGIISRWPTLKEAMEEIEALKVADQVGEALRKNHDLPAL